MKQSLDHLPESNQHQIQRVANTIRDAVDAVVRQRARKKPLFRVQKIILFGSYARQPDEQGRTPWMYDPANGYLSDYDILVIVNHQELVDDHRLWHQVDDKIQRLIPDIPVGVIVHTLDEVNNWLNQGLYFFKDIREQGIELFSEGTRELARPGNLTDEEKRAISQKHFDIWFKKAEDNFIVYELVHQHPKTECCKSGFRATSGHRSPAGLHPSHLHQLPAQSA
ncbi:nucleotidyltransferase domain-containing protein [Vibrio sp. PP-XX7]